MPLSVELIFKRNQLREAQMRNLALRFTTAYHAAIAGVASVSFVFANGFMFANGEFANGEFADHG